MLGRNRLTPRARRAAERRAVLAIVGVGVAALTTLPATATPGTPADRRSDQELLEETTAEEQSLLATLSAIGAEIARLDGEIAAITARETEVNARLAAADAGLDEAESRARDAHGRDLDAQRAVADATWNLRAEAVALYVGGGELEQHLLAVAMNADSILDLRIADTYGTALLAAQQAVVDDYHAARAAAADAAAADDTAQAEAERRRAPVANERHALEGELRRREQLRAEQQTQMAEQQRLLLELQLRKITLESEIAAQTLESDAIAHELQAGQASQPMAAPAPGSIVFPVPTNHTIGSPYGMRMHPILGYARMHRGVDFGCRSGESIVAAADGVVVVAGLRGGYGNTVVVDHGGKFATLYGHNRSLDVAVGDVVAAGDPIAACGSTGLSTGPHVHFETRLDGNAIDPVSLLPPG